MGLHCGFFYIAAWNIAYMVYIPHSCGTILEPYTSGSGFGRVGFRKVQEFGNGSGEGRERSRLLALLTFERGGFRSDLGEGDMG